jgi:hypothetical protein
VHGVFAYSADLLVIEAGQGRKSGHGREYGGVDKVSPPCLQVEKLAAHRGW